MFIGSLADDPKKKALVSYQEAVKSTTTSLFPARSICCWNLPSSSITIVFPWLRSEEAMLDQGPRCIKTYNLSTAEYKLYQSTVIKWSGYQCEFSGWAFYVVTIQHSTLERMRPLCLLAVLTGHRWPRLVISGVAKFEQLLHVDSWKKYGSRVISCTEMAFFARAGGCAVLLWKRVYTLPILVWNRVWFSRELRSVWTWTDWIISLVRALI